MINLDDKSTHEFFYPTLIHSERWKFDYVIFKKKNNFWKMGNCFFLIKKERVLKHVKFISELDDTNSYLNLKSCITFSDCRGHIVLMISGGFEGFSFRQRTLLPLDW